MVAAREGYDHGVLLVVWNDLGQHWSWEPKYDMRLETYEAALRASPRFVSRIVRQAMIEISPKALRFARLAAEGQPRFSSSAQLAVIAEKEQDFRATIDRAGAASPANIQISEETAEFCLHAMTSILDGKPIPETFDWDGNDFEFLNNISKMLSERLSLSTVSR